MSTANRNIVIFIGPPGSGKGSLSQLCVKMLGWMQLSTGYLCRKHIAEQTKIGKEIDLFIKSGKLVDDRLIIDMVAHWLVDNVTNYQGIILDGFPRTVAQAKALDDLVSKKITQCTLNIVRLIVSEDTVINRLAVRFVCENKDCQMVYSGNANVVLAKPTHANQCDLCKSVLIRRTDDELATIKERLKTYQGYEQYLVDFYQQKGQVVAEINVEKSLEMVFDDFKRIMNLQPV